MMAIFNIYVKRGSDVLTFIEGYEGSTEEARSKMLWEYSKKFYENYFPNADSCAATTEVKDSDGDIIFSGQNNYIGTVSRRAFFEEV